MDWYCIHLTNEENINGRQAFAPIITVNMAPIDFALFSRFNVEDGSVDVYVTPQLANITSSLLTYFSATPCDKPKVGGVGLLVGNLNASEFFALRQSKL